MTDREEDDKDDLEVVDAKVEVELDWLLVLVAIPLEVIDLADDVVRDEMDVDTAEVELEEGFEVEVELDLVVVVVVPR
ncbi:hypothetical protein TWF696_008055 [Orbilia brochopaga]|uniref:Uncharacterized protein n=1 Tax=Orbilia brochopaga TaxID=3140254 RepID=A0AAV9URH5_9PEZI